MRPPKTGSPVCRLHGGKAPQVEAAAERRRQEAAAREAVARFGVVADTNAHAQLALLINISAGLVAFYGWQCQRLDPDALVWGDVEARTDARGTTVIQKGEINTWLRLYNDERKELRQLCRDAIAAGLAEREVRLAESHGALVAEVLREALVLLELNLEQQTRALTVIPDLLRRYSVMAGSDTIVVPRPGVN